MGWEESCYHPIQLQRGGKVWPPGPHFLFFTGLSPQQSHWEGRRLCRRPAPQEAPILAPSSAVPGQECSSLATLVYSCCWGRQGPWWEVVGIPVVLPLLSWCQSHWFPGSQFGAQEGFPVPITCIMPSWLLGPPFTGCSHFACHPPIWASLLTATDHDLTIRLHGGLMFVISFPTLLLCSELSKSKAQNWVQAWSAKS